MLPTIILYTHTDYKDIWPIIFGQLNKYLSKHKKIIFVNKADESIDKNYEQIYYSNELAYTDRIKSCLQQINEKVILFLHEDMPLYEEPNYKVLDDFAEIVKNGKADFIKLIKIDMQKFDPSLIHVNLIKCPSNSLFSIQPTITTVEKMFRLFEEVPNTNIWQFEEVVSDICIKNKYNCFMSSFENESKRGIAHFNSTVFPYIAIAIVKGKWNFLEYKNELEILFKKYNINKESRDIF